MVKALTQALRAADVDPRDVAAVHLAQLLARSVDEGTLSSAPKLLSVMSALGLTPGGRRAPVAPGTERPDPVVADEDEPGGVEGVAALARLRAARSAATLSQ